MKSEHQNSSKFRYSDKICMITGTSDGIGKATAFELAKLGFTIVMVCRNREKSLIVLNEIKKISNNSSHELLLADLSSQDDIRRVVKEFKDKHDKLHLLINNAAIAPQKHRNLTKSGLELNFAVNYLGHFLLTLLLLDIIKKSSPARIINVVSSAEKYAPFDINDLQLMHKYSAFRAYAQSKRECILFTYELARHVDNTGVKSICLNLGGVKTKVSSGMPGFYGVMAKLYQPFALTPLKASESIIYLATEQAIDNGQYFEKKKPDKSSKESYDAVIAKKLWDLSLNLTGITQLEVN